ncbi:dapper homolog 1 isoform X2 [Acanthopagrus latus]|uniref:dapper homolog 1 isoform X2 n=1 Tax=Acanthopagrus latus TaxID=8177 RepID=UPI00187CE863|nr:dapper homolog 1 isoform X2 [Acanthopagrus latus]
MSCLSAAGPSDHRLILELQRRQSEDRVRTAQFNPVCEPRFGPQGLFRPVTGPGECLRVVLIRPAPSLCGTGPHSDPLLRPAPCRSRPADFLDPDDPAQNLMIPHRPGLTPDSLTQDMLLSAASRRDRAASDAELRSVRERLEATVSGLGELEFLRQRQEVLVRSALAVREDVVEEEEEEEEEEAQLNTEEKLLEENILLLRKQLNCLRRRDAGLISQLQELDRQISDLRLDTEASHDLLETDSRPSSDELAGCLECDGMVGGFCDDSSSSGIVRRSLSAPHPPLLDPVSSSDSQSKYHCDLVARNGSDVFRYPSPLHAVVVQSPVFLQMLGQGGPSREAGVEGLRPEPPCPAALVPQSSSWPAPSSSCLTPSHKRLDSYIFSLLQRRALPVRTNRPRTSISTDPSKSILRQASLCVRQGAGLGTLRASEVKPCRLAGGAESAAASSPQWQKSVESRLEEQITQNGSSDGARIHNTAMAQNQSGSSLTNGIQNNINVSTNSLLKKKNKRPLPPSVSTATLPKDFRELAGPKVNSSPKETKPPCFPPDHELLLKTQSVTPKSLKPLQTEGVDRSVQERASVGSSSQSQDEAGGAGGEGGGSHMTDAKCVPAQRQNVKLRKGSGKNGKTFRVKTSRASEHNEPSSERRGDKSYYRSGSKKSRLLDEGGSVHIKVSRRAAGGGGAHGTSSSRIKRLPASIPEGRILDKHNMSTLSSARSSRHHHHGNHHHSNGNHHHHHLHGREQVVIVAKPKYKRNYYRRLRAIMEVPYDEAFRRVQRRQRKELLGPSATDGQLSSPYAYVAGSDSEYSADCASLFHSTIVDTSEDERSNYTTNRFGDSESSEEEYVEESSTSGTEESGGGGAGGRGWGQLGVAGSRSTGQEMTPAQAKAFVKIKASHNLKKKILRFRSGSLKLMTTV